MKRKIIYIIFIFILATLLAACGGSNNTSKATNPLPQTEAIPEPAPEPTPEPTPEPEPVSLWPDDHVISFPDSEFEKAIRFVLDIPDGDIIYDDVKDVTELDVSGKTNDWKITDLSGIEFFSALKKLYCQGNQLTTVDVSHNTALTMLIVDRSVSVIGADYSKTAVSKV